MFKIIKYLKQSLPAIMLIILLLMLQAVCDLSLPDYTSRIINVGVQQGGIEYAVPTAIRKEEFENILMFLNREEKQEVLNHYEWINHEDIKNEKQRQKYPILQNEDIYILKEDTDVKALESILAKPILTNYLLTANTEEAKQIQVGLQKNLPQNLQGISLLEILKTMDEKQLELIRNQMNDQLNAMPESIILQTAIASIKMEYQTIGINVDQLQTNYIAFAGLKMLGIALLSMIATIIVGFLGARTSAKFAKTLRHEVYQKTLSFSTTEFKKFGVASLITRTTNDIQQVQQVMVFTLRILFYAPIIGVGGVIKALSANSSMAWIIAVAVVTVMSLMVVMFGLIMPKFKMVQKQIDRLNQVTREILTGIPVIRAFSTQKKEEKRFDVANKNLRNTSLFVGRAMGVMMPTMMLVMNSISILIVWKGSHGINDGIMQVGDMLAFIQYTMQIVMSFLMVSMFSIMFPRANVSASRIGEILEEVPVVRNKENPKTFSKRIQGLVEFKNVSFRYPDSDEDVLTDITFTAEPGKTTAFIGSTGSGKSTLVNLIPRFFDVTEGEILVDGVNIQDVLLEDLHQKIGFVPQKGILFSGTILSNIRYGNDQTTMEEVEKAAQIAQATSFIAEKKEKYDSIVAQGGTNVSGGQKQRLSIARAIATNPEIYIFDDSFSALDFKTDHELRKALKKETANATVLIVAQRINTILHADQIIVLNEGKIVGKGTHKELLKTCKIYQEIAESQLTKEELTNE